MSEPTPHFLRCSWCTNYFDATLAVTICGKQCCPDCALILSSPPELSDIAEIPLRRDAADGMNEKSQWLRCPICRKAIQTRTMTPKQNSLEIHLQHTRREQKQKLQRKPLLDIQPPLPDNDSKMALRPKNRYKQSLLRAWYPESIDCYTLFWYGYTLKFW